MSFLPANYEMPTKSDQFMKLETGNNKFRILGALHEGYLFFTEDNKPKRKRIIRDANGAIPKNARFTLAEMIELKAKKSKEKESITGIEEQKYFWIFLVYNQLKKRFQVLEIAQKGLIKEMQAKMKKEDWADPTKYDFEISKAGAGLTTQYMVDASLPKSLPKEVLEELKTLKYSIEAIFEGGYPME
jgi:hypothetical protein